LEQIGGFSVDFMVSRLGKTMDNVLPISLPCPTCGKRMKLTGHSPICESVIYDFLCSDDGDRLNWQSRLAVAELSDARP
jgi:hypothetical protein